jgi:hypothetical protein
LRESTVAVMLGVAAWLIHDSPISAVERTCPGGASPDPAVIWCDDFDDSAPPAAKYFDYDSDGGEFVPVAGQGFGGSDAMQVVWQPGEDYAGGFIRTFGRNPVRSQSHSTSDFREIYWRQYVRTAPGWSGNPFKLSRATVFAASSWAQAMIAHVWGDGVGDSLIIDPATGIDSGGRLVTVSYNDFAHLRWLGLRRSSTPIFSAAAADRWYCVEAHIKLNTPGASDGRFDLWIDGQLEAARNDLNWVGTWQNYGVNAVSFENYWNGGAPATRVRYIDNIVISTKQIGCLAETGGQIPAAPSGLRIIP